MKKLAAGLRDYYQTLSMFSRILIRRISLVGEGLRRLGGEGC
ncbi:MAG: hypothetical protein RQ885_05610 [Desulfurococcales archaeon]|nr:hypothetical protein [Desulfurococcales archaeon]